MSVSKYKRILQIAESLLQKVDLPKETLSKYYEIRDSILLSESIDYSTEGGTNRPDNYNSLVSNSKISFAPDPISAANVLNRATSNSFVSRDEVGLAIREQIIGILGSLNEMILDSFNKMILKNTSRKNNTLRESLTSEQNPFEGQSDYNSGDFNPNRDMMLNASKNFFNKLAMKKVEIKEIMEELPSTELKFINRKWLDEVDTIEATYIKFLSLQENLEESIEEVYSREQGLKVQLSTIKENFGEKLREIENLKFEKSKLIDIIKDEGLSLPDFEVQAAETVKELKESLKNSYHEAKRLEHLLSKEENFEQLFFENFMPHIEKYDQEAGEIDINNKNDVLYFIRDLLQKMEDDNKWLIEKVETCEKINCELIKIEKDLRVKCEFKDDDINNFVNEVKNATEFILQDKNELDSVKVQIRDFIEKDMDFIKKNEMAEISFDS